MNALTKMLAGLWLAALAASAAQPGGFAFAGFRRTMDLAPYSIGIRSRHTS